MVALLDTILYPFRSFRNYLKSLFVIGVISYIFISFFIITDYVRTQYGSYEKYFCSIGTNDIIKDSVIRIVGGYSEGTGFFISPDQVITNFHVIADEPSPKIIFPGGEFITPIKIIGSKDDDLAILYTDKKYPDFVLPLTNDAIPHSDDQLIAAGYPMGTKLTGNATLVRGRFVDFRSSRKVETPYIQTDINLVGGMSGGPLVDQCGQVVGINTLGVAGLSLFIDSTWADSVIPDLTDQNITKIKVDPAASPEKAVEAFYTYLKARRMKDGFNLLSAKYLQNTNYTEWTNRFTDILDVDVISAKPYANSDSNVFIKFSTNNWNHNEATLHYYEGTWQTIKENGVYKLLNSDIQEVDSPGWDWFYD